MIRRLRNRFIRIATRSVAAVLLLLTAALSLGIELLQPLINASRSADITDLITNSIGGAVGYGIYALLRPVWRRWLPEKEKRDGCRTER